MRSLKGTAASSGRVAGRACVHTEQDPRPMQPGEVLVAKITDPTMFVMILENAAGIVTEMGGLTSHPAIIARELAIPCVVGVAGATRAIPHGASLVLDGNEGTVDVED